MQATFQLLVQVKQQIALFEMGDFIAKLKAFELSTFVAAF